MEHYVPWRSNTGGAIRRDKKKPKDNNKSDEKQTSLKYIKSQVCHCIRSVQIRVEFYACIIRALFHNTQYLGCNVSRVTDDLEIIWKEALAASLK